MRGGKSRDRSEAKARLSRQCLQTVDCCMDLSNMSLGQWRMHVSSFLKGLRCLPLCAGACVQRQCHDLVCEYPMDQSRSKTISQVRDKDCSLLRANM